MKQLFPSTFWNTVSLITTAAFESVGNREFFPLKRKHSIKQQQQQQLSIQCTIEKSNKK